MAKLKGLISSMGSEETSKVMQDIVPARPANWNKPYRFRKFSFYNETPCTVIINRDSTLFLGAQRGFELDLDEMLVESIVIVEQGTIYEFIGGY